MGSIGAPAVETGKLSIEEAFLHCERMARAHYENFPVGSILVPAAIRKHVYSIYAFARTADDFADEGYDGDLTIETRLALLEDWRRQLDECTRGIAEHPVFIALGATIDQLNLPVGLFEDLLSAFSQDVVKSRYRDFDEVLDYCRRSADPVGRLMLALFGHRDPELDRMSDSICTGLQLANFWQDVSVDILKDRIYLPEDEMTEFGVTFEDLRAGRFTDRFASLMKFQVDRTSAIFEQGRGLPGRLSGRLAIEMRLTWLGGMRILDRIRLQGYDTLSRRPVITGADKLRLMFQAILTR